MYTCQTIKNIQKKISTICTMLIHVQADIMFDDLFVGLVLVFLSLCTSLNLLIFDYFVNPSMDPVPIKLKRDKFQPL